MVRVARDYLLSQLLPARDGAGAEVSLGTLGSQVRPESRKAGCVIRVRARNGNRVYLGDIGGQTL